MRRGKLPKDIFFDSLTSYTWVGSSPYKTAGVHVLHIWFSDFFWWFKCKIDWTQHDSTARQFAPGHAGHKSHLPREAALGRFCSWTLRGKPLETRWLRLQTVTFHTIWLELWNVTHVLERKQDSDVLLYCSAHVVHATGASILTCNAGSVWKFSQAGAGRDWKGLEERGNLRRLCSLYRSDPFSTWDMLRER